MFTRLGVGRLLVAAAEERARAAGFKVFTTRTTANSASFFEMLGYEISSFGVCSIAPDRGIPVTFLKKRDTQPQAALNDASVVPEAKPPSSPSLAAQPGAKRATRT